MVSIKVALDSLGCKLNQAETDDLFRQFAGAGYQMVSPDEADIYILNTCTVTHIADRKSRHLLRSVHRRNPGAVVVATGCYAERAPAELAGVKGVRLVLGNSDKPNLLRLLEESGCFDNRIVGQDGLASDSRDSFRTRAMVKVQDGCSNFCTYCIVPLVRGGERNLDVGGVVGDIKQRVAQGYREVVLTGVRIGSYSDNGVTLAGLIEHILAETGVERLRLSSLQPGEISPELISLWRDGRLCPHFHLCLQSGSDSVLGRMGRRYSTAEFERVVSCIRNAVTCVAITTDVMVGFPAETDREFEESYRFCRRMEFARIHVFSYSRRRGTEASGFPEQVGDRVKKERADRMLALARESAGDFRRQFLGMMLMVLFEQRSGATWSGLTANYIKVYVKSSTDLTNVLRPVRLLRFYRDGVWGEIVA
ncbi:MAG: tRNA (N(6)-L-threonylcarbamoyladenosine(37)-C(2))-methylthiotransferase MtaB [Dehalococcoidales bacterium]|nr:tRNA (N(6)-L-threonylcarbamoyladenosine(37)-C(2))-methylthiotransferase MtaB [Dehalococcoidales bacterium]